MKGWNINPESSNNSGGGEPLLSTVYPPYLYDVDPIFCEIGETRTITLRGFGFTPTDLLFMIQGFIPGNPSNTTDNQIIEVNVISFVEIEITLTLYQYSSDGLLTVVETFNGSSLDWGTRTLKIYPKIKTVGVNGWLDFRSYQPTQIISTANYNNSSPTFSNSGLIQTTNGLSRNSTAYTNFMAAFPDILIPLNQAFTLEFIFQFFSGSFVIGGGFLTRDINWAIGTRENSACMVSMENRSYSKLYFGEGTTYKGKEYVTGSNWNNNFIHSVFSFSEGAVRCQAFSRGNLSYDWELFNQGEFVFDFREVDLDFSRRGNKYTDSENKVIPFVEIRTASSSGCVVAMKLS